MDFRKILIQAKWEIRRPLKSKSSLFTIGLVLVTLLMLSLVVGSIGESSSLTIGEYQLYSVHAPEELKQEIGKYPGIRIAEKQNALVRIKKKEQKLKLDTRQSPLGKSAEKETISILNQVNENRIQNLIQEKPELRFALKPIWISLQESRPNTSSINQTETTLNQTDKGNKSNQSQGEETTQEIPEDAVTPDEINIPFVFESLASSFAIIAPVFFFCLYYASSIIREKVNKSGIYLLSSPVSKAEIVLGKMLPYFLMVLLITSVTAYSMGKFNVSTMASVAGITLALMGVSLVVAVVSKSPEDMNFTLLFTNLAFFAYLFYPAMFQGIHPIANISPITAMSNTGLSLIDYTATLAPIYLLGILTISAGTRLFQDDVLFTRRNILSIAYEMLQGLWQPRLGKLTPFAAALGSGVVFIPVVYMVELGLLFLLLPLGSGALFLIIPLAALAEEMAKILGVAALLKRGKLKGWEYGALAGFSFFAVEKGFAWAYLGFLTEAGVSFMIIKTLLLALAIHVITSTIAAYGFFKEKGKLGFWSFLCLGVAVLIHSLFNVLAITGVIQ